MAEPNDLSTQIPGWASDLAQKNRPGVPREKSAPKGTGAHWQEPDRQEPHMKIHVSVERPGLTPVFGTSCPPKALSGWIRDQAYRLGEARLSRWMLLLAADRIDVLESGFSDLLRGKAGNPFQEMGLGVEFRNRQVFARFQGKPLILVAASVGAAAVLSAGIMIAARSGSGGSSGALTEEKKKAA